MGALTRNSHAAGEAPIWFFDQLVLVYQAAPLARFNEQPRDYQPLIVIRAPGRGFR